MLDEYVVEVVHALLATSPWQLSQPVFKLQLEQNSPHPII